MHEGMEIFRHLVRKAEGGKRWNLVRAVLFR